MPRVATGGLSRDPANWVALGIALTGVGLLPKGWQKGLGAAAAALVVLNMLK